MCENGDNFPPPFPSLFFPTIFSLLLSTMCIWGNGGEGGRESQRKRCQSDARTLWDRKIQRVQVQEKPNKKDSECCPKISLKGYQILVQKWANSGTQNVLLPFFSSPLKKALCGRKKELRRGKPNQSSQRIGLFGISPIYQHQTDRQNGKQGVIYQVWLCTYTLYFYKLSNPTPCVSEPAAASACFSLLSSSVRPSGIPRWCSQNSGKGREEKEFIFGKGGGTDCIEAASIFYIQRGGGGGGGGGGRGGGGGDLSTFPPYSNTQGNKIKVFIYVYSLLCYTIMAFFVMVFWESKLLLFLPRPVCTGQRETV